MFSVAVELLNGIKIGIEHLSSDGIDEEVSYIIILDILIVRISFIRYV